MDSTLRYTDWLRLISKINISTEDECWLYTGSLNNNRGYGKFRINHPVRKQITPIQAMLSGLGISVPPWLHICHTCDNRGCVNPFHVYLGTPYDNTQDSIAAGTHCSVTRWLTKKAPV